MLTVSIEKIEEAVIQLCPDISACSNEQVICFDERLLWEELVCCLLSSQVHYDSALQATNTLKEESMLPCDIDFEDHRIYEKQIAELLSLPNAYGRKYRFPALRAKQIAETSEKISSKVNSIIELFINFMEPYEIRKMLIELVDGFGPKQSSMYLRNIRCSDQLAILDRHVLQYMNLLGLTKDKTAPNTLKKYEAQEKKFVDYANSLGHSSACVDYAIWIVMRVNMRDSA